jgi:hypothetical protein
MLTSIETLKKHHRQNLAMLPFDAKIAILIRMQKIAREMAVSSGRTFKGVVWCEENISQSPQSETPTIAPDE